jgi:ferredoxin-NADP reductase
VIVHWSFFFTEWSLADFVQMELQMMPMVKYGFGAWGVLGFMVLSSFGFFRSRIYELWVLQHIATAGLLLWLVHVHVPSYAAYNVWLAVGFVAFDRILRFLWAFTRNTHIFKARRLVQNLLGFSATVRCLSDEHVHVIINNIDFSWKVGQHVYLSIPRVGLLENHPFTIANTFQPPASREGKQSLELYIKVHSGFTRRLQKMCLGENRTRTFKALLSGPWGTPPSLDRFDSLVLMATGTGISFTMAMFDSAVSKETRIRRISFVWVIKYRYQIDWFRGQLAQSFTRAQIRGIKVNIHIFVTQTALDSVSIRSSFASGYSEDTAMIEKHTGLKRQNISEENIPNADLHPRSETTSREGPSGSFEIHQGRPVLDSVLLPVIENALGETGILACGNARFMADLRNYTARISDERAVHKGTGAQALYLFAETYGW